VSFWSDKIRAEMPVPPPVQSLAVAPGAWWRDEETPPHQPPTVAQDYVPAEAESLRHTERCPRCGSAEYAEFAMDASVGGTIPPMLGATTKRCFECRYPAYNPSGEIIRSKGITVAATDADYHSVRQLGNPRRGSWQGSATFDSATKIL
jgi:hypothetical protein